MELKMFLGQNLIWLMLLLGHLHGYESCIEKERNALFELKKHMISVTEEGESDYVLPYWKTNDTKSDCCRWEGVKCNHTSRRVVWLSLCQPLSVRSSLLNLSLLHSFEEVRIIDLSWSRFSGMFDDVEGYKSLRKLRNLEILDFRVNRFNSSILPYLKAATSLRKLFLEGNKMDDLESFKELINMTNLELLDLRRNKFSGSTKVKGLSVLRNLKTLSLSENEFSSVGMQGICQLKNLQELDLSLNKLFGQFPYCLTRLTRLRVLDLSSNQMTGTLPSALGNLHHLVYISLTDNNFDGFFSLCWLAKLSKLKGFKLDSKSNSLQVESAGSWKPEFQLNVLVLCSCNLQEVPHFLLHQKDLLHVDLSHNNMFGNFPSWLLANNTKLEALFLQNNSLASFKVPKSSHNLQYLDVSMNGFNTLLPENIGWILPRLLHMNLAHNDFQGHLPSSLGNMQRMEFLDISYNSFRGKLPRSIVNGCHSLLAFKLSHNRLSGEIFSNSTNFNIEILLLTMDNNQFTGNVGPHCFCGLSNIHLLDLAHNRLNGSIPSCLSNISLGLGNKDLSDEYDTSTGVTSGGLWPQISSLDPEDKDSYFKSELVTDRFIIGYSAESRTEIKFVTKHRYDAYMGGNLLTFSGLDLSENELSGGVPVELGGLIELHALNLSHNHLSGVIPGSFSGMKNMENLDFSFNRLHGQVPPELAQLSSLAIFNVSYNNLSGVLPQGRQFNTFDFLSYLGNPLLCGQPTNRICNGNNFQEPGSNNEVKDNESTVDVVKPENK